MDSVVIVGAGPAGATAARTLAKAGVRVSLLDRAAFPRNKPCGGGISLRAVKRFPYLESALARIATHTVNRLYLEGPDGDATLVESGEPAALMIRRVEFDALLVSLALEAGATLVTGVDIVQASSDGRETTLVARDGRRFRAPIVIAADGVHGVTARRLGLNPGWPRTSIALDMMEETPRERLRDVDPSTLWVSYGCDPRGLICKEKRTWEPALAGSSPGPPEGGPRVRGLEKKRAAEGYAYVFPKRDHVNVGIGYVLHHYDNEIAARPYDIQRGFVDHLRARGVLEGESVKRNFTPFLIPVGGPLKHPGRGRVLVAGDAGGFVNGVTAEGIYYAMVTGDLAARTVIDTPNGAEPSLARRYRRVCDREIGPELRDSVRIQRYLFADRRRIAELIHGASRETALTQLILDFAIGKLPYRTLRWRLLAEAPGLAGHMLWDRLRSLLFHQTARA